MGGKLVKEELTRREGISWRVERTFGRATIQTRPPTTAITQTTTMTMKIRIGWQPFATQNPAFDEYSKNLWKCGGSLELVDVFCELPQLAHRLGLEKWKERQSSREGRSTPYAFRVSSEGLPLTPLQYKTDPIPEP